MLTQDEIQREIYEAREEARKDAATWQAALRRAELLAVEGRRESRSQGELIGRIRQCEELLGQPSRPESELESMSIDALRELVEALRSELLGRR